MKPLLAILKCVPRKWRSEVESAVSSPERQRLMRDFFWVLAGQAGVALVGFVGVRVLTELAPEDVFGEANLLLTGLMLGRHVFVSPILNSQPRHHPDYVLSGTANWYTSEIVRLVRWASLYCGLACCAAFVVWSQIEGRFRWMLLGTMLLILALETNKNVRQNRLNAERKQARFAAWAVTEECAKIMCSAGLLYYWKSAGSLLSGQALGTALVLFLLGHLFWPKWPPDTAIPGPNARGEMIAKTLHYGLPFVSVAILAWAQAQSDKYVLGLLSGKAEVGLYAAAAGIASRPMVMAAGVLSTFMRPVLFTAASAGDAQRERRVFRVWLLAGAVVGVLGGLIFWLGGEWVASIALAKNYRVGAAAVIFWVALGFAMMPVTSALEVKLMASGRTRSLIYTQSLSLAAGLLAMFLLVPGVGALGAAKARVAVCTTQLLATWFMWLLAKRQVDASKKNQATA